MTLLRSGTTDFKRVSEERRADALAPAVPRKGMPFDLSWARARSGEVTPSRKGVICSTRRAFSRPARVLTRRDLGESALDHLQEGGLRDTAAASPGRGTGQTWSTGAGFGTFEDQQTVTSPVHSLVHFGSATECNMCADRQRQVAHIGGSEHTA